MRGDVVGQNEFRADDEDIGGLPVKSRTTSMISSDPNFEPLDAEFKNAGQKMPSRTRLDSSQDIIS